MRNHASTILLFNENLNISINDMCYNIIDHELFISLFIVHN